MIHPRCTYLFAALALLFIANSQAQADEEQEVKQRVQSWVETFNKNDPQAMLRFYEDTEDLDMLVSSGFWHHGIEEVKKAYEDDKKNWEYYDSNLQNLRLRCLDGFAVAAFEHRFKLRSLREKLNLQIHIRTTMTLRKVDSEWKIISEHSSSIRDIESATEIPGQDD